MSSQGCRLSREVCPVKYYLKYDNLDLINCRFSGSVMIDCKVIVPTRWVKLHADDLNISCASAVAGASQVDARSIEYDLESQTVTFHFPQELPVGDAQLQLEFQGEISDKLAGLYRSKYTAADGSTRIMAVTQFEATDARRAFPCWDEPAIKARFEVEVIAPLDRVVISNTSVVMSQEIPVTLLSGTVEQRKQWKFAETPIMSTYLLAIVVGEFDYVSRYNQSGVRTTVYTPVGKAEQASPLTCHGNGQFALDVASKALEYYAETVFKVPYPLQKSDLLAIPDFAAGAMENWGCVTYREARLLITEGSSSRAMKKAVARTVCHELAHQWFGNLVTMEWWDALWLNEGFARYMEFVAVDHIFPEWNIWEDFDCSVFPQAMGLDALQTSHPIEVEVHHPNEINEIFDAISYAKGASVIRMLSAYLGKDQFMKATYPTFLHMLHGLLLPAGIHEYLVTHKYGNARTMDLWASLQASTGKAVEPMMVTWTRQVGYPVLTFSADHVTQKRFLRENSSEHMGEQDDTRKELRGAWKIPVKVIWEDGGELEVLLEGEDGGKEGKKLMELVKELGDNGKWYKVNDGQLGFFRVNYTTEGWENLGIAMQELKISPVDRAGVLGDAFALAGAGQLDMGVAIGLASRVRFDPDNMVIEAVLTWLQGLLPLYSEEHFFGAFQQLVRSICQPAMERIGWEGQDSEPQRVSTLRPLLLRVLHLAGEASVDSEALRRFDMFVQDRAVNPLPADLRYAIMATAVGVRGASAFDKVVDIYRSSGSGEEKRQCLSALGKARDPALAARALSFILDSEEVRLQDVGLSIASLAGSSVGARLVWMSFRDRYMELHKRFSKTGFVWPMVVGCAVRGPRTQEQVNELEDFLTTVPLPLGAGKRKYQQGLENLRGQIAQLKRDRISMPKVLDT
ncbi:unnamed protein product [Discosporangium mesarthrocarpum]